MKTVQCPNCHKFVPNYPAGCQNCGHSLSWLGALFSLGQPAKKGSGKSFDFLQWLSSPASENSSGFQVFLKTTLRVLLWAIAPIALVFAFFVSIAPMLLVAFVVIALYACKVKD